MNIFNEKSYKEILTKVLLHKKKLRPHYTFEAMARACGVQKTYLSRALRHKSNLSLEQLYLACEFLKLKSLETEYVIAVFSYETANHAKRKAHYFEKINELKNRALQTEANLNLKTQSIKEKQSIGMYYVDPLYSLIHMFLTIEEYLIEPMLMSKSLGISETRVMEYLEDLETMGILSQEGKRWKVLQNNIHLSENSPFVKAHRNLLRLKSIEKMDRLDKKDFYSFTVAFSTEASINKQIREKFLNFLEEVQALVQNGKEKEVYQLNFDLLKWS
jgi:uncharacterized protein (TIGR02147 family)